MTRIVAIDRIGGPEVLVPRDIELPPPGPGEVRIDQAAVGVNFLDVYHRTGLHAPPPFPAALGVEAAGVVEAIGPGVTELSVGDRVAYAGLPVGAYASARNLPAWRLVRLPAWLSFETAAAVMLKGLTVEMLVDRVHRIAAGDTVFVHAAAGGLGLMLVGWAKHLGATVIGTVGSAEKAELARAHGLDHAIPRGSDFVAEVRRLTGGRGADHAIDGIGGATLAATLDAMAPFGVVSSVGQVAGPIPPIAVEDLGPRRSIALARPSVIGYSADRRLYGSAVAALFAYLEAARPEIVVGHHWPLEAAAEAHRALEAGATTGSIVLVP